MEIRPGEPPPQVPDGWEKIPDEMPVHPPPGVTIRSGCMSGRMAFFGCFGFGLAVFLAGAGCLAMLWPALTRSNIVTGLTELHGKIGRTTLPEGEREKRQRRVEVLRDMARGTNMGLFEWTDYANGFDALLADGDLSAGEAATLGRELDALERDLRR